MIPRRTLLKATAVLPLVTAASAAAADGDESRRHGATESAAPRLTTPSDPAQAPTHPRVSPERVWEAGTYPDETGFQKRIAGAIARLAREEVGSRCFAPSVCPDTGLPVTTLAVAGETIFSPYTGRAYVQGDTGYFGPKARGADGRLTAFGGDPLKYDLPPATARLLIDPHDIVTRAWLSLPANLDQQYHFAADTWVRFYALVGRKSMGPVWERDFRAAIAAYSEDRRPSDGPVREHAAPLSHPHNLVGEPGELLGGNVIDGGTENHKTMWRTSALLYAQFFGDGTPGGSAISGHPANEAEALTTRMLTGYLHTILTVGHGEYDSSTYYPYALHGFLNLYDLSPKAETRSLGAGLLDYYLATYALKSFAGVLAGAEKRGWDSGNAFGRFNAMNEMMWVWFGKPARPEPAATFAGVSSDDNEVLPSLHQITSGYRPNRVLCNLFAKNVPLPYEAQIAHPTYHSAEANAFQESFYCSEGFALGSVALTRVDNPAQQTVWKLVCGHSDGPLIFGGGQPRYRQPEGHSPYTQTIQSRGALLVLSADTAPAATGKAPDTRNPPPVRSAEERDRATTAAEHLSLPPSAPRASELAKLASYWESAPTHASTWLFVPRSAGAPLEIGGAFFVDAGDAFVAVFPIGGGACQWLALDPADIGADSPFSILRQYRVLVVPAVVPGGLSGYALEAVNRADFPDLGAFAKAAKARPRATRVDETTVHYESIAGDAVSMTYRPSKLRADGAVAGVPIDWDGWAGGGTYSGPYVTVKDGVLTVSDGHDRYTVASPDPTSFPVYGPL